MKIKQILYMNVFLKINFPIQPLLLLAAYENKTNFLNRFAIFILIASRSLAIAVPNGFE